MEFIRTHEGRREAAGLVWRVEPIRTVLTEHGLPCLIKHPSTYYDHCHRLEQAPSRRQVRDEHLVADLTRVHAAHYGIYRAEKVWLQLNREGILVARCTVERLVRRLDLHDVVRGKVKRTTIADKSVKLPRSGSDGPRCSAGRSWFNCRSWLCVWLAPRRVP